MRKLPEAFISRLTEARFDEAPEDAPGVQRLDAWTAIRADIPNRRILQEAFAERIRAGCVRRGIRTAGRSGP